MRRTVMEEAAFNRTPSPTFAFVNCDQRVLYGSIASPKISTA